MISQEKGYNQFLPGAISREAAEESELQFVNCLFWDCRNLGVWADVSTMSPSYLWSLVSIVSNAGINSSNFRKSLWNYFS